jgi:uncharacterized membrane protein
MNARLMWIWLDLVFLTSHPVLRTVCSTITLKVRDPLPSSMHGLKYIMLFCRVSLWCLLHKPPTRTVAVFLSLKDNSSLKLGISDLATPGLLFVSCM